MTSILAIIFFVFGTIIGSFLNVVILRYGTQKSFGGRSGCMTCQNKLKWHELIPIVSFIAIKGRCLKCRSKISKQYPLVEFITGVLFMGLFLKFQDVFYTNTFIFTITMAFYATMLSLLVVIAVYDLRHKIIPDILVLVFGILAFAGMFIFSGFGFDPHIPSILEFLSGIIVASPFAILWLVSKGTWMGLGDAKLSLGLGWLLGLSRVLSGMVVAFWSGAVIGLLLILFSKKHGMKSEIPFAPFLVFGAIISFLFELHLFPIGF
ncbi:prepilin peptidase [Patescibacteria group bacterium]|nr:prepilin peptidase [Patescibacteria group bacterium]MBU1727762.1 prepilin peptidase [Patescibacteria group bacterium]